MQLKMKLLPAVGVAAIIAFACGPAQTPQAKPVPEVAPAVQEPTQEQPPDRTYAYAGYPQSTTPESQCTILQNIAYVACYSEMRKAPLWVAYRLFKKDPVPELHKRQSRFKTDDRTTSRVTHDAYTHSGYDRGHMAPFAAIDRLYGQEAGEETFLMSNVVPQLPGLNRGVWRTQEKDELEATAENGEVWLIVGPMYDDEREFLDSGVEIPDMFYRALVYEDGSSTAASVRVFRNVDRPATDNEPTPYETTTPAFEKFTGLDFPEVFERGWGSVQEAPPPVE